MDEKNQDSIGYAFKGKIMISSITILFSACFIIVTFHVYSRWCRHRRSDHHLHRLATPPTAAAITTPQGLDLGAVNSLPTFVYGSENQESETECAVCLSEFEVGETGRILPECKHCFHVDCIDAWLQSHRHCPLCRSRVQGQIVGNPPDSTVVSIYALDPGTGLSPTEESDRIRISCPSSASSSEDPDVPKRSAGQDPDLTKMEGAPDPDGNLSQDQGFRVTRFWL